MADIIDLLKAKAASDPQLRSVLKRVEKGTAGFKDTAEYSVQFAHLLGRTLSDNVINIPTDVREAAAEELLRYGYDDINAVLADVQTSLDNKAGIHIRPQKADFPTERVQQLTRSLIDPTVADSVIKRRARAGSETITKSFHDSFIKKNATFRNDAGLTCYIIREGTGCCQWCSDVAGKYKFGTQPSDIFRRHDNCDCTIIYDGQVLRGKQNTDGSRSKTWEEVPDADGSYNAKVLSEADSRAIEQRNLQMFRGVNNFSSKPGKSDSAIADIEFINSQKYADKFKGKYANPNVENAVVSACRQIIKNRNGTFYEEAFFIDANTGKTISYVKGKRKNGVNMPEKLKKRLTNAPENSIIMIHNHPNSSPFSTEDYNTSSQYSSLLETLACGHNGDVYAFRNIYGTQGTITNFGSETVREYHIAYQKHKRTNTDFEARHKSWDSVAKNRGFNYERR